ncbi:MAG: nitrite reductase, copper-containing [Alphaproteobacteria bacterium]|nr:nitrite reductase, copper-containing [Alphaproteobacteria bacterium]
MTVTEKVSKINNGRRAFLTATAATSAALAGASLVGPANAQSTSEGANPLGVATSDVDISSLPRVRQKLVAPPFAPEHDQVAKGGPKVVQVEMTIIEKKIEIDHDGTSIWAFTYEGTVPGPLIVCHQGDYIELTLRSDPNNELEHNVDFHAATGALGGAALTYVQPGEEVVLQFRAIKAGTFTYHCAPGGVMIPYHVVHGMNGAVMVLPRDGLKNKAGEPIRYDRLYYIGEQDFYIPKDTYGNYKHYDFALEDFTDSLAAMRTLVPTHVVFNGKEGALAGDNAMTAKVGETVMFVHNQANRDSRPHLIGGHGDYVWEQGGFDDDPATGIETWFIRGGSAGVAIYTFKQPGIYAYVTHNLIEAVLLGAVGHVKVEGEWDDALMKQLKKPTRF